MVFHMTAKTLNNEESVAVVQETEPEQDNAEEEHAFVLQKLKSEESYLTEEKQKLQSLKEKLSTKAKEEIEIRNDSIRKLKEEITDLKVTCDKLTKALNSDQ